MVQPSYRKVNRKLLLDEIKQMIIENGGEVEISSSELADRFKVQAPTIDYHLNVLLKNGDLVVSPKRGKYNRKIYRLPDNELSEKKEIIKSYENQEKFKEFIQQHLNKIKKQEEEQKTGKEEQETLSYEETNSDTEATKETEESDATLTQESVDLEPEELTLDDRIKAFLEQAKKVHSADELLPHKDKEILSVVNETINQNMIYLKDLTDQLSTVQNKELIQHLIDDRNRLHEMIEKMENELNALRKQKNEKEKNQIDPRRVRFMHQLIISTIDSYLNQPNHALALGRNEFRKKVSKEIQDLVRYVLGLED